jgi:hypothetical protein
MPTRIGETAGHCDQRLVRSCCTTRCRSCGGRRCRRLRLQRPRLSTIQHLWQGLRFSISELFSNDLATLRRRPHKCTRTAPRASSAVICGRGLGRAKHFDICKHFAHEVIRSGEMKLIKVSTTSQLADILASSFSPASTASCEWTRTSAIN